MKSNRMCPICKNELSSKLYEIKYELPKQYYMSNEVNIVCCNKCGFVYKDKKDDLRDNNEYEKNNNRYEAFEQDFTCQYLKGSAELVGKYFDKKMSILDVGCCTGYLLFYLKQMGFNNLYGLEPSVLSCDKVKQKEIEVVNGSIYDKIEIFENKFNVIILSHVLEHLIDLEAALNQLKKWLKDDGCIYISVPDEDKCEEYYGNLASLLSLEHVNHFSPISLDNLMKIHGFNKIHFDLRPYHATVDLSKKDDKSVTMASFDSVYRLVPEMNDKLIKYDGNTSTSITKLLQAYTNKQEERMKKLLVYKDQHFIIWGVSHMAMNLLQSIREYVSIDAFVDSDPSKHGLVIDNIEVKSAHMLKDYEGKILLMNNNSRESILSGIDNLGIKNEVVIL